MCAAKPNIVQVQPICNVYAAMHDLPVLEKREKCREMLAMRDKLLAEVGGCFVFPPHISRFFDTLF